MEAPRIYLYVDIKLVVLISDAVAIERTDKIVISILKLEEYFLEESGG
jgi:hypothetical protein